MFQRGGLSGRRALGGLALAAATIPWTLVAAQEPKAGRPQGRPEVKAAGGGREASPAVRLERPVPPAAAEFFPPPTEADRAVFAALTAEGSWQFDDTPLAQVVAYLREQLNVNIVIDRAGLTAAMVDPDTTTVKVALRGARVDALLRRALTPLNLTSVVEDGALTITSRLSLAARPVTRTYPVADLVESPEDFKALAEAVREGAGTRGPNEQKAAVTAVRTAGCLVVRHDLPGHEDVLQLLRDLRCARRQLAGVANDPATGGRATSPGPGTTIPEPGK